MTLTRTEHGRSHRYTLDGERVKSVTTLINGGLPKPQLPPWSANSAARYVVDHWQCLAPRVVSGEAEEAYDEIRRAPDREWKRSGDRRTAVHGCTQALLKGRRPTVGDDELSPYIAACADFLAEWGAEPVLTETVVGSRLHSYAGTLDLVANLPGGQVALFGFESGSGIYPQAALEAAAYRYADFYVGEDGNEAPIAGLGITAAYAVHLRTDGYAVRPLRAGERTFRRFREIATVARNAKTLTALVGEAVTPAHLIKTAVAC
nr:hypothetical protein OH820_17740 [Streptomyces sp. NBC_00857]